MQIIEPEDYSISFDGLGMKVEAVVGGLPCGEESPLVPLRHIVVIVRLLCFHRETTQNKVTGQGLPAAAGGLIL